MKTLIPVADGSEEMEVVICADVLRRAGWPVDLVGLTAEACTLSRGVRLLTDRVWTAGCAAAYELLVIPGGIAGVDAMRMHAGLLEALERHAEAGRPFAAVCAGPLVLQTAGVLNGRRVTCHPSVADQLTAARWEDQDVVVDDPIVTGQGPGSTFAFALTLVAMHDGMDAAQRLTAPLTGLAHLARGFQKDAADVD